MNPQNHLRLHQKKIDPSDLGLKIDYTQPPGNIISFPAKMLCWEFGVVAILDGPDMRKPYGHPFSSGMYITPNKT